MQISRFCSFFLCMSFFCTKADIIFSFLSLKPVTSVCLILKINISIYFSSLTTRNSAKQHHPRSHSKPNVAPNNTAARTEMRQKSSDSILSFFELLSKCFLSATFFLSHQRLKSPENNSFIVHNFCQNKNKIKLSPNFVKRCMPTEKGQKIYNFLSFHIWRCLLDSSSFLRAD